MVLDIALKKISTDTLKHDNDNTNDNDNDNDNAVSIMQKPVVCSICKSNNVITDPESAKESGSLKG